MKKKSLYTITIDVQKVAEALCLLDQCNVDIEVVQYIDHPMSKATLKSILKKLGYTADQLLRKTSKYIKNWLKVKA